MIGAAPRQQGVHGAAAPPPQGGRGAQLSACRESVGAAAPARWDCGGRQPPACKGCRGNSSSLRFSTTLIICSRACGAHAGASGRFAATAAFWLFHLWRQLRLWFRRNCKGHAFGFAATAALWCRRDGGHGVAATAALRLLFSSFSLYCSRGHFPCLDAPTQTMTW